MAGWLAGCSGVGNQEGGPSQHASSTLSPTCRARWDLLIVLAIFYSCGTLPLRAAFGDNEVGPFFMFDMGLTVLFLLDILLNFNTGYDDDGLVVMDKVGWARGGEGRQRQGRGGKLGCMLGSSQVGCTWQ